MTAIETENGTVAAATVPAPTPPTPAPPAVAVLRMPRREVDVEVGPEYPGFRAVVWVNYPARLQEDIKSGDSDRLNRALAKIVLSHNGWADEDGNVLPQPGESVTETFEEELPTGGKVSRTRVVYPFWASIPDELAAALITIVNAESTKLPNSIRNRLRSSAGS